MGAVSMSIVKLLFLLLSFIYAVHSVLIQPADGQLNVTENSNAVVMCIAEAGEAPGFLALSFDGLRVTDLDRLIDSSVMSNGVSYTFGPVNQTDGGLIFECNSGSDTANTTLQVYFATCDSGLITAKVNYKEKTPIPVVSSISANPDVMTINCMVDGGIELPDVTIDLSDNATLMLGRADFTIIDIYPGTVQVTCTVRNTKTGCSSPLLLRVNYDDAPCGAVSGCLATVLVVVSVVAIALAVGITVTVVVVVKKM